MSVAMSRTTTRGVVFIHGAPAALCPHITWALEAVLDQKFMLFQHDDKPPHNYHALAEWGWDETGKRFVSTVQDS